MIKQKRPDKSFAMVSERGDLCKTIGFPPLTGEMSEGQRGPSRDDQAKRPDKSFATVSPQKETIAPCARKRGVPRADN